MSRLNLLDYFKDPPTPRDEDIKRREVFLEGLERFEVAEPHAYAAMMDYFDAEVRGAMYKVLDVNTSNEEAIHIRYKLMALADLVNLIDSQKQAYQRAEWLKSLEDERQRDLAKRKEAFGQYANQHRGMQ